MSDTPRTDAERRKTHTPEYEYEGAEWEAWEWGKKLERELNKCAVLKLRDYTPEQWEELCSIQRPDALWVSGEQMDRLMKNPPQST